MLRIKLVKSPIGNTPNNRAIVKALGLKKMNQIIYKPDSPVFQGMIHKIKHLLEVDVVDDKSLTQEK